MRRLVAFLALVHPLAIRAHAQQTQRPTAPARPSFAEPGISPDGREIAFVSAGDIWTVATQGGEARLLVAHPASESRPIFSPDGTRLAFVSNRAGSNDVWLLTLASGAVRRLTWDDGAESLDGWSRDGRWIYFSTSAHDVAGMNDVYRVRAEGGTPMPVAADRYASEFMSAPDATGEAVAIVARGFGLSQWWRKGTSHLDESELWLVRGDGSRAPTYEKVMPRGARQLWPMWSGDGRALYFVSDRGGAQNLWRKPLAGEAVALTRFTSGRVLWPSISANGAMIAFERDFAVWTMDVASGTTREVPITRRGAISTDATHHLVLTTGFTDLALSPDGKKVAFVARGEVFVASAADAGDALRITSTPSMEGYVGWATDSRRLVYAANRDGRWHLFTRDVASGREVQLTTGGENDVAPRFSPDGNSIAFVRGGDELCVIDVDSKVIRTLARGVFGRPPMVSDRGIAWSPDGRWIAYLSAGTKMFVNAWIVPSAGGEARQASWLSNTRASSISWSADGAYLLLDTGMRMEPGQVARVDLLPYTPRFREEQLEALFRDETPGRTTPPATPPIARPAGDSTAADSSSYRANPRNVRIVFDGIRNRLSILPLGVDVGVQSISPDGKQLAVTSTVANQPNVHVYSLDELASEPAVARPVTATPGNKGSVHFSPDGKSIWYLDAGRVTSTTLEPRSTKTLAVRAELDVDFAREKWEVFHQAWEFVDDNFYDPKFHGIDWRGVRGAYAPYIAGAETPDEMRRVLSLLVGELNASHMGVSSPPLSPPAPVGRLGLEFDRAVYERNGEFRVSTVVAGGAADAAGGVRTGDRLVAIDGAPLGAGTNLDSLLAYKSGRRVMLTLAPDGAEGARRTVAVSARSAALEKVALYRAWTEERRALVAKLSGGRLGYVHMLDMGNNALANMNLDLDAENHAKAGVVLDVRHNNGGFMNGHALDVLSRKTYVVMQRRGVPPVPGRPVLGQRALDVPTIALTSQHTLSDGENFTEGYRTLGLGKVVGEPTAGWDVYTSAGTMVDGTTVRLPFMTNAQLDMTPLELRSRAVDIPVDRPMGESYTGRDVQLERAVAELLKVVEGKR